MTWSFVRGGGPVITTAIHAGHELRPDVLQYMALDEKTRLREEDPYTDQWTDIAQRRIIVNTSRFELDLNRPFDKAVYLEEQDAWGLRVWKEPLPAQILQASRDKWEQFYQELKIFLDEVHTDCGNYAVLDIHSFCHRRRGPGACPDDPEKNPVIDIGTGSVDKARWSRLIRRFIDDLRAFDFDGAHLDVRENAKFQGGYFTRWINGHYGKNACAIAIEFKKIFMDEWTGELDVEMHNRLKFALASTLPGLISQLAE